MREIIIASGNAGKIKEFGEMLCDLPVKLTSLKDYWNPLPDIEENGATFHQNALIKADWVFAHSGGVWALADDSGLEVDSLGGAPGVYSARYAGKGAPSSENNKKLLAELSKHPELPRTARFRCVLVVKLGPGHYVQAEGACEGVIGHKSEGTEGFGYDPLFIPAGFDRTFAQLTSEEKHRISHRGIALRKLREELHEFFM